MTRATTASPTSAFTTIDFDGMGKQIGHVMFPHAANHDAWGMTPVPIAVIANGKGPTVIREGGHHGDGVLHARCQPGRAKWGKYCLPVAPAQ